MKTFTIVLLVILVILIVACVALYFVGKKAEKKLQEKELMAEEEKTEVKPDPSQMSLW